MIEQSRGTFFDALNPTSGNLFFDGDNQSSDETDNQSQVDAPVDIPEIIYPTPKPLPERRLMSTVREKPEGADERDYNSDNWRSGAACQYEEDPDLFFGTPEEVAAAKRICDECVVRQYCLQYAFDNNISQGVWGGMTENRRRSIRRQNARARANRFS